MHWLETRSVVPVIREIQSHGEAMRQAELERARRMLARGDDPEAVLEALSGALTRKFLHGPTHALNHTQGEDREALLRLVPGLFRHSSHSER
ncbi:Glutamyl-tRNA reductase [compost metagenome]